MQGHNEVESSAQCMTTMKARRSLVDPKTVRQSVEYVKSTLRSKRNSVCSTNIHNVLSAAEGQEQKSHKSKAAVGGSQQLTVQRALSAAAIFRGCCKELLAEIAKNASRIYVAPGAVAPLEQGALLIVEEGVLSASLNGLSSELGAGTILNCESFLGLDMAPGVRRSLTSCLLEQQENRTHASSSGFDVMNYSGPPPDLFNDRAGKVIAQKQQQDELDSDASQHLSDNVRCFYNLCPLAARTSTGSFLMNLVIVGSSSGHTVVGGSISAGATVAIVPLPLVEQTVNHMSDAHSSVLETLSRFQDNRTRLQQLWSHVRYEGCGDILFPGAPSEVHWAVLEASEKVTFEPGQEIVSEGQLDDDSSIYAIDQGFASVEKLTGCWNQDPQMQTIGRLWPGAIIGDLCLAGAAIPHAATVRAKTQVEGLRISVKSLVQIVQQYPGLVLTFIGSLMEAAQMISERLLTLTEVASTLSLFSECDYNFINDIAHAGERKIVLCGNAVVEEGCSNSPLFVLEFGRCRVEVEGLGVVSHVPAGNCFGERTLLGIAQVANATVRVATPFAIVIAIPSCALQETLVKHRDQKEHFELMKNEPVEGRVKGSLWSSWVAHTALFRNCGMAFLQCLSELVHTRGYMPGQTLVVENAVEDDSHMFVLVGGQVAAERNGQPIAEMSPGATFGELAVLGLSSRRSSTVRAITFCFVREIPRSALLSVFTKYPEEEEKMKKATTVSGFQSFQWPCLKKAPSRLQFLLDLYVEKKTLKSGDRSFCCAPASEAAILLLEGEAILVNEDGKEVGQMFPVSCYNEQILLDMRPRSEFVVPKRTCKFQILSKGTWKKVAAEFPHEQDLVHNLILEFREKASVARLGIDSGPGVLRRSPLFEDQGMEFLGSLARSLQTRLCNPGDCIVVGNQEDVEPQLVFILEGTATIELSSFRKKLVAGEAFGEANILGVMDAYPGTVRANALCTVQTLHKKAFENLLQEQVDAGLRYKRLQTELNMHAALRSLETLKIRLHHSCALRQASPAFIASLCRHVDPSFFAPGTDILSLDDPCELGKSCFFLVLAGRVRVDGPLCVELATQGTGEVIGEIGAFGFTKARTANVRACPDGFVCCARFDGQVASQALQCNPQAQGVLAEFFSRQQTYNAEAERKRQVWLESTAVPALAGSRLLSGCPIEFLRTIAVSLSENSCTANEVIITSGEQSQSMVLVLKGLVEVEAKSGEKIGLLRDGGSFGEVGVLGLFPTRMATLRAVTDCRIMDITYVVLRDALATPHGKEMKEGFRRLVNSRYDQVAQGLPLSKMSLGFEQDDMVARAVGLLSERIILEPGRILRPLAETDPCGPHYWVLVFGRAVLEMGSERHMVMSLTSGSLVIEDLASEYKAHIRAEVQCESYRIRVSDFWACVLSHPAADDWMWKFKLYERDVRKQLCQRLKNVKGVIEGLAPHEKDQDIQAWTTQRKRCISRARKLRHEMSDPPLQLPQVKQRLARHDSAPSLFSPNVEFRRRNMSRPIARRQAELHLHLPVLADAQQMKDERTDPGSDMASGDRASGDKACGMRAQSEPHLRYKHGTK